MADRISLIIAVFGGILLHSDRIGVAGGGLLLEALQRIEAKTALGKLIFTQPKLVSGHKSAQIVPRRSSNPRQAI